MAICILTGEIVWVNGPFAPGIYNDLKIFTTTLAFMLDDCERVEADDGYAGADPEFAKAKSMPWHPTRVIDVKNEVRAHHETVHNRMKFFAILRQVFKNGVKKHQEVVLAVTILVQLQIQMGEPLFEINDYVDVKLE